MTYGKEDKAIANLIANTRTKRRSVSLFDFHAWLKSAIRELGTLDAVADKISLSPQMLKQFLVIDELDKAVIAQVKKRRLDSVDALNYVSLFSKPDQRCLVPLLVKRKITNKDLRSIYQQRKVLPEAPIAELVGRVIAGKTKRIYELQFVVREGLNKQKITKALQPVVGIGAIESLRLGVRMGAVTISKQGLDGLRSYARKIGIPFKNTLSHLFYP